MMELRAALSNAFDYLSREGVDIPADVWQKALVSRALKADGDISDINAKYHDNITEILTGFFEDGGSVTGPKNQIKRAMVESFGGAFDGGWVDGGQELPADEEALDWFNERVNAEMGFIDMLLQQAKELRKEEDFDYFAWVTARADGYTNTLKEVYNAARLRAMSDQMVTFDGDDGAESCPDCQKLKGKRHKISWFVARNYVPPFGTGLECHKGGHCQHGLFDKDGNQITV